MSWAPFNRAVAVDPEGVRAVLQAAYLSDGVDPRELAWIIGFESGWDPHAVNPLGAVGLIQWIPSTLRALHMPSSKAMARMSRREQAPYVARYFAGIGRHLDRPGNLYLALFYSAALSWEDSEVIGEVGSDLWRQNKILRGPDNGPVTAGSVRAKGTPPASGGPALSWVLEPVAPEPKKKTSLILALVLAVPIVPIVVGLAMKRFR